MPKTLYIIKYPLISVRSGKLYCSKSSALDFSMSRMLKEPTITVHPFSLLNSLMSLRMSTSPHILASAQEQQHNKRTTDITTTTDIRRMISTDMLCVRIVWNTQLYGHTHSVTVNTVLSAESESRPIQTTENRAGPATVANSPGKYRRLLSSEDHFWKERYFYS